MAGGHVPRANRFQTDGTCQSVLRSSTVERPYPKVSLGGSITWFDGRWQLFSAASAKRLLGEMSACYGSFHERPQLIHRVIDRCDAVRRQRLIDCAVAYSGCDRSREQLSRSDHFRACRSVWSRAPAPPAPTLYAMRSAPRSLAAGPSRLPLAATSRRSTAGFTSASTSSCRRSCLAAIKNRGASPYHFRRCRRRATPHIHAYETNRPAPPR